MSLLDYVPGYSTDERVTVDLDTHTVLDMLKNDRRRLVIHLVAEAEREGTHLTLSDAAEAMAMAEQDCEEHELGSQERKRTYVSLYQTHVPKLCEHGVLGADDADAPGKLYATDLTEPVDEMAADFERRCTGERSEETRQNTDFSDVREAALGGVKA